MPLLAVLEFLPLMPMALHFIYNSFNTNKVLQGENMKKSILTIGALCSIATPIVAVVSCGSKTNAHPVAQTSNGTSTNNTQGGNVETAAQTPQQPAAAVKMS